MACFRQTRGGGSWLYWGQHQPTAQLFHWQVPHCVIHVCFLVCILMDGKGDWAEIEAAKGSFGDVVKRRVNWKKSVYYPCAHFLFTVWLGGFVSCLLAHLPACLCWEPRAIKSPLFRTWSEALLHTVLRAFIYCPEVQLIIVLPSRFIQLNSLQSSSS